jgi:pimeloyl-ACP methyl ester carboxylesterase
VTPGLAGVVRRRRITIDGPRGGGVVAGIEIGPEARPLDVLFLHANGFNAFTYAPILAPLAPALRVLAVDLRGHGLTALPVPAAAQGWRLHAEDLGALIGALGEMPAVLAGHSMGGTTALLAAPALPGVAQLVLFDPVIVPQAVYAAARGAPDEDTPFAQGARRRKAGFESRDAAFAAYRGRGAFRGWPDGTLRAYLEDGLVPAADGFVLSCAPAWEAANFASYAIDDPVAGLPQIAAGIRILRAAESSTCALEGAPPGRAAAFTVETVAGASHFLPMEHPEAVRGALRVASAAR